MSKKKLIKSIINSIKKKSYYLLKSEGLSMLPLLQPGDILHFRKVPYKSLKVNDIVVVSRGSFTFAHRIVYRNTHMMVTKGDNNLVADGKITRSNILGRVNKIIRNGKKFEMSNLYLMQSSVYLPQIAHIVADLKRQKINYVFLKGLPLHLYYEKKYPGRIYADCDLLISADEFNKVKKLMRKAGYRKLNSDLLPLKGMSVLPPAETSFMKIINGVPVVFDIHTEPVFMMTQIRKINAFYPHQRVVEMGKEFLEKKQQVVVNGIKIPILSPVHLIIYLALHFFHHNFKGIFRLDLLRAVIRHETKRSSSLKLLRQIVQFINRYSLTGFVYPVFRILNYWFPDIMLTKKLEHLLKSEADTHIGFNMTSVFDDENRMTSGIHRFLLLFKLSPQPFYRRLFVIFNPEVLYFSLYIVTSKITGKMVRFFRSFSPRKKPAQSFYF